MGFSLKEELNAKEVWEKMAIIERMAALEKITFIDYINTSDLSRLSFKKLETDTIAEDFEKIVHLLNEIK